jgi:hypothetical protein
MSIVPMYIVPTKVILGTGIEKTAYECEIREKKNDDMVAFDLPVDPFQIDKLCIIEVKNQKQFFNIFEETGNFIHDIEDNLFDNFRLYEENFGLAFGDLFKGFNNWDPKDGPVKINNDNDTDKANICRAIMWSIDAYKFENEMRLHADFAKHGFAPKIFGIQINGKLVEIDNITKSLEINSENTIFVLLEKCTKRNKSDNQRKFLGNLRQLVSHFVDNENLINMDFKDGNVCPLGRLSGLDFDTRFMLIIDRKNKDNLKTHGKIYMLTQFLAERGLQKEYFNKDFLKKVLQIDRNAIKEMVIYFIDHPTLSINDISPISNLCFYCIRSIQCINNGSIKTEKNLRLFINELCSLIFQNINGGRPSVKRRRHSVQRRKQSVKKTA